ncbi:hypothetical protein PFH44_01905 [Raoultella sp. Ech2A]|uniref:hypothetical protein n=1 Tax=Raoultella sp. Ech2A TaxID=2996539 RepID=UPI0024BFC4E8|nr:hypothetical protein [Raoultella sp. Ech2A]MDJ1652257.1 hypothetical protein [Raoultella sp. Ech2A]
MSVAIGFPAVQRLFATRSLYGFAQAQGRAGRTGGSVGECEAGYDGRGRYSLSSHADNEE